MLKRVLTLTFITLTTITAQTFFYLQESQKSYGSGYGDQYFLKDLDPSWKSSQKYGFSMWINKQYWGNSTVGWQVMATVVQNLSDYSFRSLLFQLSPGYKFCFSASNPSYWQGDFNPWGNLYGSQMAPIGNWIFFSTSVDATVGAQYGFRYYLNNNSTSYKYFETRSSSFYALSYPNTQINVGGYANISVNVKTSSNSQPSAFATCCCYLQHFHLFIDYAPNNIDQMLNLAMMTATSSLFLFRFESYVGVNSNSSFIVEYYNTTVQGNLTGLKGYGSPGADFSTLIFTPDFGPYNTLQCRNQTRITYYAVTNQDAKGVIASFDFKPYSDGPSTQQTLFSVTDTVSSNIFFTFEYTIFNNEVRGWILYPGTIELVWASSGIQLDEWNRVVVELLEMQPDSLGLGYYSGRIWINNNSTINQSYFGNFTAFTYDFSNIEIQICSRIDSSTNLLTSSVFEGMFDMMNFNLFVGGQRLYSNISDATCNLTGFLSPNQRMCFFCQNSYFYDLKFQCVSSCPQNTFPHAETRSCQSCYYGQSYVKDPIIFYSMLNA